jgi:hypothetical protein
MLQNKKDCKEKSKVNLNKHQQYREKNSIQEFIEIATAN